jgi:type IV pilus assembly protein PilB
MSAIAKTAGGEALTFEVLERRGLFRDGQKEVAREVLAKGGDHLVRALVKAGAVDELEAAATFAEELALSQVDLELPREKPELHLASLLTEKFCTSNLVAPLAVREDTLDLAVISPEQMLLLDEIQFLTELKVRPLVAPLSYVEQQVEALYRTGEEISGPENDFGETVEADDNALEGVLVLDAATPPGEEGRIFRMVNQILDQALRTGASDIHLEPFEDVCKLRLRIDGVLQELPAISKKNFLMIISRFKVLAKMDIAERRIPQDGAIAVKAEDKRVDLRVNTVPTVYGEKMVMRILDKGAVPLDLTKLGLTVRQSEDLIESIKMPHGLALVTGPTGSGKSTTLYSCLNLLNEPKTNICTVEDPVEYKFKGLNQVQVKSQVGLTFASALRAFLRQDPDVIMVGEVRDQETAQICLRAALTGHFVISTIHTNDALAAVTRLQDMGIEPFLLASTLRVLEAQRLVRRLCPHCKEPYPCSDDLAEKYGLPVGHTLYKPRGCNQCRRVGYRGRVGVFEVIRITPELAKLIQVATPLPKLREAARSEGMKLLFDTALEKVAEGATSLEAALTVAVSEDD